MRGGDEVGTKRMGRDHSQLGGSFVGVWRGCRGLACEVGPKRVGGGRSRLVVVAEVP